MRQTNASVCFPSLPHHQSALPSLNERQLRSVLPFTAFRPLSLHKFTLPPTETDVGADPPAAGTAERCSHLENSAADEPAAAVAPDPKLSVVVRLAVRNPVPAGETHKHNTVSL